MQRRSPRARTTTPIEVSARGSLHFTGNAAAGSTLTTAEGETYEIDEIA